MVILADDIDLYILFNRVQAGVVAVHCIQRDFLDQHRAWNFCTDVQGAVREANPVCDIHGDCRRLDGNQLISDLRQDEIKTFPFGFQLESGINGVHCPPAEIAVHVQMDKS